MVDPESDDVRRCELGDGAPACSKTVATRQVGLAQVGEHGVRRQTRVAQRDEGPGGPVDDSVDGAGDPRRHGGNGTGAGLQDDLTEALATGEQQEDVHRGEGAFGIADRTGEAYARNVSQCLDERPLPGGGGLIGSDDQQPRVGVFRDDAAPDLCHRPETLVRREPPDEADDPRPCRQVETLPGAQPIGLAWGAEPVEVDPADGAEAEHVDLLARGQPPAHQLVAARR